MLIKPLKNFTVVKKKPLIVTLTLWSNLKTCAIGMSFNYFNYKNK